MEPTGRLNLSLRKKLWKSKGSLTLSGYDVLHTAIASRYIYLPEALVHFTNMFDRRQIALTFTYSLGKKVEKMDAHTTGVEAEKGRL
jgi:hypothetical protein